jgi:hypothetical protein
MSVWSISISAAAFLVSMISFYYSRRSWSESNRPLVTARVSSLGMGGNSVREIVEEVLEEAGLSRAIDEGLQSKPTTRDEVFQILDSVQNPTRRRREM